MKQYIKIHSIVADWPRDRFSIPLLVSSFIYVHCKIHFQIDTLFLQKENKTKQNKKKERHFAKCVQICFFHVYSKETRKSLEAGQVFLQVVGSGG